MLLYRKAGKPWLASEVGTVIIPSGCTASTRSTSPPAQDFASGQASLCDEILQPSYFWQVAPRHGPEEAASTDLAGNGALPSRGGGKRQRAVKRRTSQRRVSVVQPCGLCPSPHQHIAGRVLCALCGEPARQGRGTGMKTTTNLKSIFHRTKSDAHSIQPINKK